MSLQTYDPSEVSVFIALLYETTGFAPNSLVQISKDTSSYQTLKGGAGGVERVKNEDETYTMTLSLSQTSPTNSILNALAVLDNVSGRGIFPIFVKDSSGQSLFLAGSCWIESPATASYTGSIETREWTIKCSEMNFSLAGNDPDESLLQELTRLAGVAGQFF